MMKKFLFTFLAFLFLFGCNNVAPTIHQNASTSNTETDNPGTNEMTVSLISPVPGATGVRNDTYIVLSFSEEVDYTTLSGAVTVSGDTSGNMTFSGISADARVYSLDPSSVFANSETVTVTMQNSITSTAASGSKSLYTGAGTSISFSFDIAATTAGQPANDPAVIADSRYPAPVATVSVNTSDVYVAFSKPVINVSSNYTITGDTSGSLEGAGVATDVNSDGMVWRLPINGPMTYGELVTVILTTGITDTFMTPITAHNWSFNIEAAPVGFAPFGIEDTSIHVTNISDTSITVKWTTTEPVIDTNARVYYGTTSGYGNSENEGITGTDSATVHSVTLTGLTAGTKYYFQVYSENAATATDTHNGEFITAFGATAASNPGTVLRDAGTTDNSDINLVQSFGSNGTLDGSSYVVWLNSGNVYGYYFDTDASTPWLADGETVDNNTSTNVTARSDGFGSTVIIKEDGTNIRAKIIYNNTGSVNYLNTWHGTATAWGADASATGNLIAVGANTDMTIVWGGRGNNNIYGGFITPLTSGTTEMDIPSNEFYDFTTALSTTANVTTTINNGDHIINNTSHNHSTVTQSTNFRHVLGQGTAVVAAGNDYTLASDTDKTASENTADHATYTTGNPPTAGTNYTNTGPLSAIYTEHNYNTSKGAWSVDQYDLLLDNNGNYRYISLNPTQVTLSSTVNLTGNTATTTAIGGLIDSSKDFSALGSGFQVDNTTAVTTASESGSSAGDKSIGLLRLDAQIFYGYPQNYAIDPSGLNITGTTSPCIVDDASPFTSGIIGEIAYNTGTSQYARIEQYYASNVVSLGSNLFPTPPGTYNTYTGTYCQTHLLNDAFSPFYQITVDTAIAGNVTSFTVFNGLLRGTATNYPSNPLYDDDADFTSIPLADNDVVINITPGSTNNTLITEALFTIKARALDLSTGIMNDGDSYQILRFIDPAENTNIIQIGTATTRLANGLTDSNGTFNTAPNAVKKGDIVYDLTDNEYAVVALDASSDTQLTLNKDIFEESAAPYDSYIIFRSTLSIIEMGINTATGSTLTDTDASFQSTNAPVTPGDVVHNHSSGEDAIVISVDSGTQLTLNRSIMNSNDPYHILQPRALFVYENSNNILGTMVNLRDGSNFNDFTICTHADTMQNPHTVSDGIGGAFVIYKDVTDDNIYGKHITGTGTLGAGGPDTSRGVIIGSDTIIDVQVVPKGSVSERVYILYEDSGTIYLTRRDSSLADSDTSTWTVSVTGSEPALALDSSGDPDPILAYVNASNDIVLNKYDADNDGALLDTATLPTGTDLFTPVYNIQKLSIAADENGGAIISWIDDRYYPNTGLAAFIQSFDSSLTAEIDEDSDGTGTDFRGRLIGILNSIDDTEAWIGTLVYNNGTAPWDGIPVWYDYRNGRADIFYDTLARP